MIKSTDINTKLGKTAADYANPKVNKVRDKLRDKRSVASKERSQRKQTVTEYINELKDSK